MTDDDLEVSWCVVKFGRIFLFSGGFPAAAAGDPHQAEVHGRLPPALLPRVQPDLKREIPGGDFEPSISFSQVNPQPNDLGDPSFFVGMRPRVQSLGKLSLRVGSSLFSSSIATLS